MFIMDECTIDLPFPAYLHVLIFNPKENNEEKEKLIQQANWKKEFIVDNIELIPDPYTDLIHNNNLCAPMKQAWFNELVHTPIE